MEKGGARALSIRACSTKPIQDRREIVGALTEEIANVVVVWAFAQTLKYDLASGIR